MSNDPKKTSVNTRREVDGRRLLWQVAGTSPLGRERKISNGTPSFLAALRINMLVSTSCSPQAYFWRHSSIARSLLFVVVVVVGGGGGGGVVVENLKLT